MSSIKPTVAFFLPSLGGGGAEMHLLRVLNHGRWDRVTPHLFLARHGGAYERALNPRVRVTHLLPKAVKSSTLSLLLAAWPLRHHLARLRPTFVCSLLNHATVTAYHALPSGVNAPRFIVGLQNNPSHDLSTTGSMNRRWFIRQVRRSFARANQFVALSHGVADDFLRHFPEARERVTTIYNAGFDEGVTAGAGESLAELRPAKPASLLVTCGRLTRQKNHALLLHALAQARKTTDVHLWLLGRGELRGELEALTDSLGLSCAVRFLGFQTNPFKYIAAADAFALSSDWEGFGNVIVEAMALGKPVISTACPFGPPEIIQHEKNGLLVPVGSVQHLSDAIVTLCTDHTKAARLAAAGRERANDFNADHIAEEYEQFFHSLARPRSASAQSLRGNVALS